MSGLIFFIARERSSGSVPCTFTDKTVMSPRFLFLLGTIGGFVDMFFRHYFPNDLNLHTNPQESRTAAWTL
jgi:hypothetical protein